MLWAWGLSGTGALALAFWARPKGPSQSAAPWYVAAILLCALLLALTLQALALGVGWRWGAWATGMALGASIGAWGALGRGGESDDRPLGGAAHLAGLALAALSAIGAFWSTEATQAANAAIGMIAAWSLAEWVAWGARPARNSGAPLALAWSAALAATWLWTPVASPSTPHGGALLTLAALVVPLAWAAGAKSEGPALPVAGALAAALAALAAAWLGGAISAAVWTLAALALLFGLLAALVPAGPLRGPGAWMAMGLAALALLFLGRMGGFAAMASACLLLGAATGGRGGHALWAVVATMFAGRAWLQIYLQRTELTSYGMDLTHPYAHAGLWVGALLLGLVGALRVGLTPAQGATLGLGLAALPLLLGHAWHPEALGTMLVGLAIAAAYAAGHAPDEKAKSSTPGVLALAPSMALGGMAFALMGAPWLVYAMHATRATRAGVLLVALVLALLWLGWRAVRRDREAVVEV